MSIMNFTYTKADGKISERTFVPIYSPFTDYFGVDVSELDGEAQAIFATRVCDLEEAKREAVNDLMAEFDIKNNFRMFKADKMSDIVIEETD